MRPRLSDSWRSPQRGVQRGNLGASHLRTSIRSTLQYCCAFALLLACTALQVSAQEDGNLNITILAAPATPTSMSLMPGPVPGAPNLTAQPLPQAPNPGLGSATIALDLLPAGIVAGIPVPANFLGISIELSVASDIFGEQLSNLYAPFLNYVSTISTRLPLSMGPSIRVGGNTQDTATYNTSATAPIVKVSDHGFDPETGAPITPFIQMSPKLFDIMQAVGEDLRAQWVFGVNFVNLSNTFTQPMVRDLSSKLSTKLQMLLVGNEPDRYSQIGRRGPNYTIPQYLDEWDTITSSIIGDTPKQKFFVAPSVCCAWTTDQVIVENGMANRFQDRLAAISAIKYPQSLCATGPVIGHAFYLNHTNTIEFGLYDQDAVATAIQLGLPYTLIETNTASCIGIDYVSNAFSSTLWGIDAALQLAYRNHSGMYLHTAGQSVVYNLFTPPSYRQSIYTAWRTGPIMYALPFVAEALNSTDGVSARVRDLGLQTPAGPSYGAAYGIYEDDAAQVPSKVVLLNLVSDQSGANTMRVQLPPADQQQRAVVKFLAAATAAEQQNITWAGQTFGYYSDGVLNGQESVQTIRCNDRGANNTGPFCTVTVPAPGAAIVYLTPEAQATAAVASRTNAAFEPQGTADPAVVIDSNGSRGRKGGATSKDSASGAAGGWRSDKQASRSAVITCVSMALLSALAPLAFQIM